MMHAWDLSDKPHLVLLNYIHGSAGACRLLSFPCSSTCCCNRLLLHLLLLLCSFFHAAGASVSFKGILILAIPVELHVFNLSQGSYDGFCLPASVDTCRSERWMTCLFLVSPVRSKLVPYMLQML